MFFKGNFWISNTVNLVKKLLKFRTFNQHFHTIVKQEIDCRIFLYNLTQFLFSNVEVITRLPTLHQSLPEYAFQTEHCISFFQPVLLMPSQSWNCKVYTVTVLRALLKRRKKVTIVVRHLPISQLFLYYFVISNAIYSYSTI